MEGLVSLKEVEKITGRSVPSLRRDVKNGRLVVVRLGHQIRVNRMELFRILAEGL